MRMRVIISAGGTGGHIYPALAIINKIKEMGSSHLFFYASALPKLSNLLIKSLKSNRPLK